MATFEAIIDGEVVENPCEHTKTILETLATCENALELFLQAALQNERLRQLLRDLMPLLAERSVGLASGGKRRTRAGLATSFDSPLPPQFGGLTGDEQLEVLEILGGLVNGEEIDLITTITSAVDKETGKIVQAGANGLLDVLGIGDLPFAPGMTGFGTTVSSSLAQIARRSVPEVHIQLAAGFLGRGKLGAPVEKALTMEQDEILLGNVGGISPKTDVLPEARSEILRRNRIALDKELGLTLGRIPSEEHKSVIAAFDRVRDRINGNLEILLIEQQEEF